jgi:VWFA-related protein
MNALRITAAALLISLCSSVINGQAKKSFQIKVDVDLVTTDVTVIGKSVSELKREDFVIYDNSVAQPITFFSHDELPLAVVLLVDVSGSIKDYLPSLKIAALSCLRQLKPQDQAALISFSHGHKRNVKLTHNMIQVAEKIGQLKIQSTTNIYDAIHHTTEYLRKAAPDRRRAVILISDNCQAGPFSNTPEECLTGLLENSTALYGIKIHGEADCQDHQIIKSMAEQTGSEAIEVNAPGFLHAALEKTISSFRMGYSIGFNPSEKDVRGAFHKISVKFSKDDCCPGCRILSRNGYYAGIAAPALKPIKLSNPDNSSKQTNHFLLREKILTAAGADFEDIDFIANTSQQRGADGKLQVIVNLHIYPEAINFKKENDQQVCNLQTAIFLADKNGNILGTVSKKIEGSLNPKTYERALKTGIPLTVAIPQKASIQMLRIVVYDEANDMAGSKIIPLQD